MISEKRYFVICNPASGYGKGKKQWPKIRKKLAENFVFDFAITEQPRHAEQLVEKAIEQGYNHIIAVGGDGLLQEVANGILTQKVVDTTHITVSLISMGTGNDWRKTSGMPKQLDKAIAAIKAEKTMLQNVGLISYFDKGEKKQRYCINFAGVGFDSYVVANTLPYKKYGEIAYLLGMVRCLFSYRKPILRISSNEKTIEAEAYMCIAGIGKYGGGGMKLIPHAVMDTGGFGITLAKNFTKSEVIRFLPKLFTGDLVNLKKVDTWHTEWLKVEAVENPESVFLEADGELFGTGPFEMKIIPNALRVMIA
jgi:diacylglycerol kinase (ATP)